MTLHRKKILITCGPTWVAIDGMRVISNRSTGELGHRLAVLAMRAGARVTLLEGPVERPLGAPKIRIRKFHFFDELQDLLRQELKKKYDAVIHAAAVSDYRTVKPSAKKIGSDHQRLRLELAPTPKLIDRIKGQSPTMLLVGFKLADGSQRSLIQDAATLARRSRCDLMVANTIRDGYRGWILDPDGNILAEGASRATVARALMNILKVRL